MTFKGQGQLEPGDLYVPGKGEVPNAKEWEGTKWRGDEASTQLGAVTFEITVDESTGKVTRLPRRGVGPRGALGHRPRPPGQRHHHPQGPDRHGPHRHLRRHP